MFLLRLIGNIFWFLFGGLLLMLMWGLLGVLLCITIVGIPLGLQCFKFARLSLFPFGKKVDLNITKHLIANIIWAVLLGWWLALIYLLFGILNCITIIGIPKGLQCFKFMKLALFPFGAEIC